MNLNQHVQISTLPYTGREPCIYWGDRGFGVRVYPSGAKKFVLSYRASGRKRLLTVGNYPALSLDKAKDMAAAYRLQIGEGGDPVLENRFSTATVRAAPKPNLTAKKTVTALCDAYLIPIRIVSGEKRRQSTGGLLQSVQSRNRQTKLPDL